MLTDATRTTGGRSLIEMIWQRLDVVVARLMEDRAEERDAGRAEGLATALAILTTPYDPDVSAVRDRAVERWEERRSKHPAVRKRKKHR